MLTALVATWLVDVPHTDLERCRRQLLDVRDVLQQEHGRASDRITPELWRPLAQGLGLPDEEAAQRHVRALGRRTTHLSRLTWSRVDHLLAPAPARPAAARPRPSARAARPGGRGRPGARWCSTAVRTRPGTRILLLRAAALAAERGLMLAPATAARIAPRALPRCPTPGRRRRVAGSSACSPRERGLLAVWETLDETGALQQLLPEWERIRLLPHASTVHRFTVDRHVVETCIEAAPHIRRVARPDLLLVAAVLHDIGKGGLVDHGVAGEPVAAEAARRMGFDEDDVRTIARLVRWHLLLADVATTQGPGGPEHGRAGGGSGWRTWRRSTCWRC